jgi:hypothetical protein
MRVLGCILAALMCFLHFLYIGLRGVDVLKRTDVVWLFNVDSIEMSCRTAAKE